MKITVIFSCSGMFRDVPECSGMFRVSGFIDAPIYPLYLLKTKITERNVNKFQRLLRERKGMKLLSYMCQRIDINQTQYRTCS